MLMNKEEIIELLENISNYETMVKFTGNEEVSELLEENRGELREIENELSPDELEELEELKKEY